MEQAVDFLHQGLKKGFKAGIGVGMGVVQGVAQAVGQGAPRSQSKGIAADVGPRLEGALVCASCGAAEELPDYTFSRAAPGKAVARAAAIVRERRTCHKADVRMCRDSATSLRGRLRMVPRSLVVETLQDLQNCAEHAPLLEFECHSCYAPLVADFGMKLAKAVQRGSSGGVGYKKLRRCFEDARFDQQAAADNYADALIKHIERKWVGDKREQHRFACPLRTLRVALRLEGDDGYTRTGRPRGQRMVQRNMKEMILKSNIREEVQKWLRGRGVSTLRCFFSAVGHRMGDCVADFVVSNLLRYKDQELLRQHNSDQDEVADPQSPLPVLELEDQGQLAPEPEPDVTHSKADAPNGAEEAETRYIVVRRCESFTDTTEAVILNVDDIILAVKRPSSRGKGAGGQSLHGVLECAPATCS